MLTIIIGDFRWIGPLKSFNRRRFFRWAQGGAHAPNAPPPFGYAPACLRSGGWTRAVTSVQSVARRGHICRTEAAADQLCPLVGGQPISLLSSWGLQAVDDARHQRMWRDVMSGIVATEGSFWRSTWVMLLIDWGGTPFCLGCVLEHLTSTVYCGSLTLLRPDYSLARRGLPQRQAFSRETQLDPPFLLYQRWSSPRYPLRIQCVVFGRRFPRLRSIGLGVNESKFELTILNDSMPEAIEAMFIMLLSEGV